MPQWGLTLLRHYTEDFWDGEGFGSAGGVNAGGQETFDWDDVPNHFATFDKELADQFSKCRGIDHRVGRGIWKGESDR